MLILQPCAPHRRLVALDGGGAGSPLLAPGSPVSRLPADAAAAAAFYSGSGLLSPVSSTDLGTKLGAARAAVPLNRS